MSARLASHGPRAFLGSLDLSRGNLPDECAEMKRPELTGHSTGVAAGSFYAPTDRLGGLPLLSRTRDHRHCFLQFTTGSSQRDFTRLIWFGPHDHQAKPIERFSAWRLERFEAGRIAIVGGDDFSRPFHFEFEVIVRTRSEQTVFINHSHRNK